jgi:hypothetical protein
VVCLDVYLSVLLVDTRQVHLGGKGDLGRKIGVVGAAMDLDAVNAILVDALQQMSAMRASGDGQQLQDKAPRAIDLYMRILIVTNAIGEHCRERT